MIPSPSERGRFHGHFNAPLPPTPNQNGQPSPHQHPNSPLFQFPHLRETQLAEISPSPTQMAQQNHHLIDNDQTIVGPSDHYGIHLQQFNNTSRTGAKGNRNLPPATNNVANQNFKQSQQTSAKPSQGETKVCVTVDTRTPVIIKVPVLSSSITLADLKRALPAVDQPNYRYFFKTYDSEAGIVREEIQDDNQILPIFKDRVVAWIDTPGHIGDDLASRFRLRASDTCNLTTTNTSYDDRSSSALLSQTDIDTTSYFTETDNDSLSCSNYSETTCDTFISQRRNNYRHRNPNARSPNSHHYHDNLLRGPSYRNNNGSHHRNNRSNTNDNISSPSSSSSPSASSTSYSDATAVQCITVHLILTSENFLGLHIYANTVNNADEGIYVDGVTENSAVAQDGRIEPGDKLIQVNEVNLEELSNEEAVKVLKDAVIKRGPLKLVVAKFVETNKNDPIGGFRELVHPIDTAAWVAHAQAITMPNNLEHANSAGSSPSFSSNTQDTDRIRPASTGMRRGLGSGLRLNRVTTDIKEIVQSMKLLDVGLEIKDREWLKIQIPNAFIGSDLVSWLERNVYGFSNGREAKKFAGRMLKEGHIKDPISSKPFSAKSYYTFVT